VGHLLMAAVTTAYILVAIVFEERDLLAHLGDAYREYRGRTPKFIPAWPARGGQEAQKKARALGSAS